MPKVGQRHAHSEFDYNWPGHPFYYHSYFSYTRAEEWNEGEFKVTGTVDSVDSESINFMSLWIKFFIPNRMRKEEGFVDIEYEATHLTSAMGSLDREVSMMKKDRQHMTELLDDVVRTIGRKKPK